MIRFRDLPNALFRFQAKNCNTVKSSKKIFWIRRFGKAPLGLVPIQRILFSYFKIISLLAWKSVIKDFKLFFNNHKLYKYSTYWQNFHRFLTERYNFLRVIFSQECPNSIENKKHSGNLALGKFTISYTS